MEKHTVGILELTPVTHDVLRVKTEKPAGYEFVPGQATEVAINRPEWKEEKRPFTFTGLPEDEHLEFTIKMYPSHEGATRNFAELTDEDELILHEVFGTITYKGEGIFIAGGAGVTPFISILRMLWEDGKISGHKLLFGNRKSSDIIMEKEFREMLGDQFVNILSEENIPAYDYGMMSEDFLRRNIGDPRQYFYVCGPPPMMKSVLKHLSNLGVEETSVVKEEF